ncbi:probable LRR receptor-like serine/threonine-protein kinase at1g56140 [Phtheirospermum japonicum]|uniref:non-specific serine/threonine protein kinase n=1 Tax=Phtheirospermum japonicum TaxID=374723 RepID=A0A830C6L7_9LAMI|nr:probable LRR receptor-like serine/threonine-protein kinase at1g56140 [Phtheirospermum japonicum]
MFNRWRISATNQQWNISGELCSGVATDTTPIADINPGIKCDCTANNRSTCHITALRVYALDVGGPLPNELWNLTFLTDLNLGQNYLTGPIPATIGNLVRMQYLSLGINALSGELPRELGLLTDLISLSFSTNNFTGPLPSELGSLSRLTQIYFDSSGVSGPIPDTFGNLQSLQTVWASDNELTGRIPNFIGNWSNLVALVLRNNNVSGSVPSFFGAFQSLTLLDLSFNNLTGRIPDLLFNHSSLTNFALPFGLDCLQRNFPCNRGNPIYSSFAINSGGRPIGSSDQTPYESDNETLGPATYYVTNFGRWGVSNVGLPADSASPQYQTSSQSQFTNTLDSELFRDARISAGSLRYYGLGLENGNYTVRLQFAETQILGFSLCPPSSVNGSIVVLVQGNLERRDFDILRRAGGVPLRAVVEEISVRVTENYLEVHLFWAGKGTCCVPVQGAYGPLISAISARPDFVPTVANRPPGGDTDRTGMIVGIVVAVAAVSFLALGAVFYVYRKRKRQRDFEDEAATDDFNLANKLGEGGFGPVYKGTLGDGRVVAVKQLSVASHQGKSQFVAEIATISAVQHRNLVKLPNSDASLEDDKIYLLEWAWNLHESDREIELVDPTLQKYDANEVRRIIGIALLCTQASPALRPPMSRVVGMLSGDIEVPSVTTRPGYLTDWKFDDTTTFVSEIDSSVSNSDVNTGTNTTTTADYSPTNPAKPMLHEIIGEGR